MRGYIEREMSKIILALPTKLDHVEIFEQAVTGSFSSVNTDWLLILKFYYQIYQS